MDATKDELPQAPIALHPGQTRWEVPKALAIIAAAGAVFFGFVLAAANFLHPAPQQITVHVDAPLILGPPSRAPQL